MYLSHLYVLIGTSDTGLLFSKGHVDKPVNSDGSGKVILRNVT